MDDVELLAEKVRQADEAILRVRGRAQASEGLVVVEADAYGAITDLRISPYAMSVDADSRVHASFEPFSMTPMFSIASLSLYGHEEQS